MTLRRARAETDRDTLAGLAGDRGHAFFPHNPCFDGGGRCSSDTMTLLKANPLLCSTFSKSWLRVEKGGVEREDRSEEYSKGFCL